MGSGLVAAWLNATAANADRDTLSRGADAVQSNVEEQVRILELAGTGTRSLAGQPVDEVDLSSMVGEIDLSVLTSLLTVVSYPVDENGAGPGERLLDIESGLPHFDFEIPNVDLSLAEFEELRADGNAFFSAPFSTDGSERLDYIVAIPADTDGRRQLVGIAFRPDRMLKSALAAAGEGQYAVDLIDVRFDGKLVATLGSSSSALEMRRSPDGVKTALELIVRPGPDFHFAQTPWVPALVVGTGVVIALLLVWMGRMVKARSEDLAERLRLAQELNESKDRFLATVSHELRTPLTVVLGVASEIGPNWEQFDDHDRQDLMTMMTEQAVEAANIVEDLLVAARSDPSQLRLAMENTNLLSHVEYALASLPDDGRSRVVSYAHDHPVWADTTRLRQILRNLLENAVRYGGDEIAIECELEGNTLHVIVSDNGGNLAEQDIDRIFEPYEQSNDATAESPSGVGIGLYVSRLLARLMNGDLDCAREDDRTRFRLSLTVAEPRREAEKITAAAAS